jgi:hypothetical protein
MGSSEAEDSAPAKEASPLHRRHTQASLTRGWEMKGVRRPVLCSLQS